MTSNESLSPYCSLKAGGTAEWFYRAFHADELAEVAIYAQQNGHTLTVIGGGSNLLPSDAGVPGIVAVNQSRGIWMSRTGEVIAETGVWFQELFLKTAQCGFGGLEYAVGIPGSVGGALVSNAGAYRSNISEHLVELEVVQDGERKWVSPDIMEFSYRDSILRSPTPPALVVLRIKIQLPARPQKEIFDEARDYQRQRIGKQPPPASAGSFFKNINDHELAQSLSNLPERLKSAGVVPAGYLLENAGMAGFRLGGAMLATRHANFMLNVGGATATEIRSLAKYARDRVFAQYGRDLEEEVLYLGDWSQFVPLVPEVN
ncbi:MAG: UDP-N-acetylmuramate dehydrogenase [Armatimonadetes bacterium]|nr:UDP-N-acetylmuramate dehydrogenase [Armatimonadota bacterium]